MQATAAAACRALPVSSLAGSRQGAQGARPVQGLHPLALTQRGQRLQALGDKAGKGSTGIRREDEPEEYWTSQAEKDGKSPFQDPLAQIGILAILFPFIFLLVAIAFGWVDLNAGVYGK